MAGKVEDLIDSAQVTEGKDGFTATRLFRVDSLEGDAPSRLQSALLTDGVPQKGDAHPSIPDIVVINRNAVHSGGGDAALITLEYGRADSDNQVPSDDSPVEWTIESTLQEVETTRDVFGNEQILEHTFIKLDENGNIASSETVQQLAKISKQIPLVVARGSRKETSNPFLKSVEFVGTINANVFFQSDPTLWLCSRLSGTTDDGGFTFRVEYEFILNVFGWDVIAAFFDKENNEHPIGLESGTGIREFPTYIRKDFGKLQLNAPF